jgi:RNase P subunit RPR2
VSERPEQPILSKLLRGALAVCVECRRPLEPGEPRVTVRNEARPTAPLVRCSDCEYRRQVA